ncbi:MAG: ABC transporter substrate-binding protein [Promethearchaeota archaeon]
MALSRNQILGIVAIVIIVAATGGGAYYYFFIYQPAPPTPPLKTSVTIGCALSLTGPYGGGAELHLIPYYNWIVDTYNDMGGLYLPEYGERLPIVLTIEDDEGSVENLLTITERMITVDQVDFLFPPWGTALNFAAFPLYQQYGYPVVALTVGANEASARIKTGEWNYVFLTLGQPAHVGNTITSYLSHIDENITSLDSIGIVFIADQHGVEYGGSMFSALQLAGFNITVYQSYPIGVADFTPIINELKLWDCDVMIASSYPADGMFLLGSCIAQGYSPDVMFFGPGVEVPFIIHSAFTPTQTMGIHFYDGYPATAYDTPDLAAWADLHNATFGFYPFPASALFYSALEAFFQAIEQVGLNRALVRDTLATETFDTVIGDLTFVPGEHPEIPGTGYLTQWQGGDMMEVVWPLDVASASIIAPKPVWPPGPPGPTESLVLPKPIDLSNREERRLVEVGDGAVRLLEFATMDISCPKVSWRLN